MQDLTEPILELVRLASTDLPPDVEKSLRQAVEQEEPGSAARSALETILKNVEISRANSTPICQDTGTPIFYVHHPEGWSTRKLRAQIESAVVAGDPEILPAPQLGRLAQRQEHRQQPGRLTLPHHPLRRSGRRYADHRPDAQRRRLRERRRPVFPAGQPAGRRA